MPTPDGLPQSELDEKAHDVFGHVVLLLLECGFVEGLVEGFETSVAQMQLSAASLHEDLAQQLISEFLCFAAFNTSVGAPGFIGQGQGEAFVPDIPACHVFNRCVRSHLAGFCVKKGLCGIADPVRHGMTLDPTLRLHEYAFAESKRQGSSVEHFTRLIGFSFGPANHFVSTTLAMHYARPLLELAIGSMRMVFGSPQADDPDGSGD